VGSPLWARVCVILGAILTLASAGTLAAVQGLTHRYEAAVHRDTLIAPQARPITEPQRMSSITGPLNFLLIGSDFRAGLPGDGQRADTIIIAHVPRTLDRAYLISIPRDLLVQIPPYPPNSYRGGQGKINGAFQFGGPQLLSATLTELIGIRFNGAAIVNFEGFKTAVDVLGGVYLCVDRPVTSNHLGVDRDGRILQLWADENGRIQGVPPGGRPYVFEEGCQRMNGMLALDYARLRYGLPGGDYDRQRHQQQFLKAVFQEATRDGLLSNPIKLDEFLRAVGSSLTVDTGEIGLADLVFGLRNVTPSRLVGVKVPSEPRTINGVSYVVALAEAQSLYQAIREDTLEEWITAHPSWAERL
jgi:LCP family protein required for cell wall assembly